MKVPVRLFGEVRPAQRDDVDRDQRRRDAPRLRPRLQKRRGRPTTMRNGSCWLGCPGTISRPAVSRPRSIFMNSLMTGSAGRERSPTNGVITTTSVAFRLPHNSRTCRSAERTCRPPSAGNPGTKWTRGSAAGVKSSGICRQRSSRCRVAANASCRRRRASSVARTHPATASKKSRASIAVRRGVEESRSKKSRHDAISRLQR